MTVCTIIIGKAGILPQRKEKKIMRKKLMTWLLAFAMIFTMAAPAQAARGGVEDFVRRLYQVVLQREPDAAGLADWCDALTSGRAQGAETAAGFYDSIEFKKRDISDSDYVEMLYTSIMGRSSDAAGKADWLKLLQEKGVTRNYVLSGFLMSPEFGKLCDEYGIERGSYTSAAVRDQNSDVTAFVKRLYSVCLNRQPDSDGWDFWTGRLLRHELSGAEAARGFFYSQEFLTKGLSNEEFVRIAYRTLLDRDADAQGFEHWTGKLNDGNSWEFVIEGFIGSQEFSKLCDRYGITPGEAKKVNDVTEAKTIVIDAGHQAKQMKDKEAVGPGSSQMKAKVSSGTSGVVTGNDEYQINLDVALLLRDELTARGYNVIMTRETNDVRLSNQDRARIANEAGADAMIRIHCNSVDASYVRGALCIIQSKSNPYCGSLSGTCSELSNTILKSYCAATGLKNMGIQYDDNLTGTNWCQVPNTVLEMGFMSNAAEDRLMGTDTFKQNAARGIADGLDAYFGR